MYKRKIKYKKKKAKKKDDKHCRRCTILKTSSLYGKGNKNYCEDCLKAIKNKRLISGKK